MIIDALLCCEVVDGREVRDGATVRRGGDRLLLAASEARRLAADGVVQLLDEADDAPDGCAVQRS